MTELDHDVALVRRALEGSGILVVCGGNRVLLAGPFEDGLPLSTDNAWWRALVELARRVEANPFNVSISLGGEPLRPSSRLSLKVESTALDVARKPGPAVALMDEIAPWPFVGQPAQSYADFMENQLAATREALGVPYEALVPDLESAEAARAAAGLEEIYANWTRLVALRSRARLAVPIPAPPGWPVDERGHALRPEAMTPEQRLHLAIGLQEAMDLHHGPHSEASDEAARLLWFAWDMGLGMSTAEMMRALGQEVGDV